jgi:uncharacterized protein YhaN
VKLLQLNLRAYGPFTNRTINFEGTLPSAHGGTGLHLILGANEAGKSTALRALRAVLFGMDEMRDAYLHPKDMLRVGLKVKTAAGELLDVERRKGKGAKSLLFAGSDKAVPVEEWTRALPIDSADLFEQMFGLNYERLLEGGRYLASFKGDIGQAILSAAGDLGQTVNLIREMQDRAGDIYAPRASSSKLNRALAAYKAADKAIRDERYTSREYKLAVARRDEILEELQQIAGDLARCAEEQSRLTRLHAAAPHVQRLLQDEEALKAFVDTVPLADDFEKRYSTAIGDLRAASERENDAVRESARLAQELDTVPRDTVLAGLVTEIDRWKDLSGKILAARSDRPKREADWKRLRSQRDSLCGQLGITADAVPRPVVEQRKRIELLSRRHLVSETKKNELPGRIVGLELRLRDAELSLSALPEKTDTTELAERLAQVRGKKQPEAELRRLRLERDQFTKRLNRDLQTLPLWSGTAEQLEALRVPFPSTLSEFADRFVKKQAREQQLTAEASHIAASIESCTASLNLLDRQRSIPTESE